MHCSKTHEKIMAELRHPMLALAATCGDYVVALASTHELKPVGKHDAKVEKLKGTACALWMWVWKCRCDCGVFECVWGVGCGCGCGWMGCECVWGVGADHEHVGWHQSCTPRCCTHWTQSC